MKIGLFKSAIADPEPPAMLASLLVVRLDDRRVEKYYGNVPAGKLVCGCIEIDR